ncbi:hypothetical protein INT47_001896 [Mucor saturninus]|uniref:ACT domain-containing protein n=1 Tax=Mucor saturninus TaxID=64648 RepID=A0A8H7RFL9_9FUNG|nr:hypothetical protein INT47_001896 [Mucor saturninus]
MKFLTNSARTPSPSTSALSFKSHIRQKKFGPVPTAEDAVRNILHNTPGESEHQVVRHTLSCLAQNEPGVLSKVSSVLASRNFNIESMVAADTEIPDLSRMTIVFKGEDVKIDQAMRQLEELVPVWAVLDYTHTRLIERELLLIKVSILGSENLITKFHNEDGLEDQAKHEEDDSEPDIASLEKSAATALRATFDHLRAVSELANLFEGNIVDVSSDSVVVQVCAKSDRITSFIKLCKPFGIIEAARSGVMALPRAPLDDPTDLDGQEEEDEAVDLTSLPPG